MVPNEAPKGGKESMRKFVKLFQLVIGLVAMAIAAGGTYGFNP